MQDQGALQSGLCLRSHAQYRPRPAGDPGDAGLQRVVECKIAAALLGKGLGLEGWQGMSTLKAVQEAAGKSTAEMVEYVAANLQEEPYTTAALTEELGSLSELLQVLSLYFVHSSWKFV